MAGVINLIYPRRYNPFGMPGKWEENMAGDLMLQDIGIHTEREAGREYLVVELPEGNSSGMRSYQVEMLASNKDGCFIPVAVMRENEKLKLCYDITSKTNLKDYSRKGGFDRNCYFTLLSSLALLKSECGRLLINHECVLLGEEYIFTGSPGFKPLYICIPAAVKLDCRRMSRDLIINVSSRIGGEWAKGCAPLFAEVFKTVRAADFELEHLGRFSADMARKAAGSNANSAGEGRQARAGTAAGKAEEGELTYPGAAGQNAQVRGMNSGRDFFSGKYGSIKAAIAVLASQAVLVAAALATDMLMKRSGTGGGIRYLSISLFVASADYLVYKLVVTRLLHTAQGSKPAAPDDMEEYEDEEEEKAGEIAAVPPKPVMDELPPAVHETGDELEQYPPPVVHESGSSRYKETSLLGPCPGKNAWLIGGDGLKYEICKDSFIIGRNSDIADMVIDSMLVGRMHAEITKRGGEYYLWDNNSKNGTFLNGVRLENRQELKLCNEDCITFANTEYIFTIF